MKAIKYFFVCVLYLSMLGCQSCKKDPIKPDPKPTVYCTVTLLPASGVTVTPIFPNGSTKVEYGKPISLDFNSAPNTRYKVLVNGTEVISLRSGNTYYQNPSVTADLNIQIVSEAVAFTVTASAGIGGTVTPLSTTVEYGSDLPLTITENTEYTLTSIKVNGVSVVIVKPYVLKNITANSDVQVGFTLTNFLTLSNGADNKSRYWNWKTSERMDENHVHEYFINLDQDQLTWKFYFYSNGKGESFNTAGVLVGNGFWSVLPNNIYVNGTGPGADFHTIIECSDKKFVFELKAEYTQGRLEIIRETYVRQ